MHVNNNYNIAIIIELFTLPLKWGTPLSQPVNKNLS